MLTLFEELFLLTIRDDKIVVDPPKRGKFRSGLVGAMLAELVLQGKLKINEAHRLELVDATNTGDEILDKTLLDLQVSERPRKATFWVETLSSGSKKLQKRLFERLVSNGVFAREEDTLRWMIPSQVYPDKTASAKYCLKSHLRAIALADGEADVRSLTLLNLLKSSNLHKCLFTKDEQREARHKIHEKFVAEAFNNPAVQGIEEILSAVASI